MTIQEYKKSPYPFEEFLKEIHAKNYMGTDDDMPDSFDTFITNLDNEELIEHANVFSKILIEAIQI